MAGFPTHRLEVDSAMINPTDPTTDPRTAGWDPQNSESFRQKEWHFSAKNGRKTILSEICTSEH